MQPLKLSRSGFGVCSSVVLVRRKNLRSSILHRSLRTACFVSVVDILLAASKMQGWFSQLKL